MAFAGRLTPTIAVGRNRGLSRHGDTLTLRSNGDLNFAKFG